jgi:2-keto-3-deoxy-L-rhamnonate aldolase RhmA
MTEPLIGTVLSLPGCAYAELVARHLDFVWIDLEHGALGAGEMQDAIVGVQAAGTRALVRLPTGASPSPALDAGADGIVVPRVRSVAAAQAAVAAMRHAPEGVRGYGPRRLAVWPRAERPACVMQVEDEAGMHASPEIARLDGVDALVVGAADLSFELGEPLAFDTPRMKSAIEAVADAARAAGVLFGLAGMPLELALGFGPEVMVHATDVRLIDSALRGIARGATAWLSA